MVGNLVGFLLPSDCFLIFLLVGYAELDGGVYEYIYNHICDGGVSCQGLYHGCWQWQMCLSFV